jgi:acyl-coenzyme A synthetase/AMP-(fatty) acid ligase
LHEISLAGHYPHHLRRPRTLPQTYFSTYPGMYFTGDGCLRDEDGYYRITGRVDDVLNVSGHRIGTAEVENAINMHLGVVESAVVGYAHDIKGQGIYAYVITEHAPRILKCSEKTLPPPFHASLARLPGRQSAVCFRFAQNTFRKNHAPDFEKNIGR